VARLIYSVIASLDGYVADENGNFDWAAPDEEVHAFVNALERPIGTYLFGRRMYETLAVWDRPEMLTDPSPAAREFAEIWQAARKIVYSTSLSSVSMRRTRLEHRFDTDAVRRLKAESPSDLSVGGPNLAGQAIQAGLVDEIQLFLCPVTAGGGNAAFPRHRKLELELVDQRRFTSGVMFLRFSLRPPVRP
jgi:dihydrofolate reductase